MSERRLIKDRDHLVTDQTGLLKRIIKNLARELGISLAAAATLAGIYNKFLWWYFKGQVAYVGTRAGQAVVEIGTASVENLGRIVAKMTAYIAQHPIDVGACAGSVYLSKESKGFQEELMMLAQKLGEDGMQTIGAQANKITNEIMN